VLRSERIEGQRCYVRLCAFSHLGFQMCVPRETMLVEDGGGGDRGRGKNMIEMRETEHGDKMMEGGAEVKLEEKGRERGVRQFTLSPSESVAGGEREKSQIERASMRLNTQFCFFFVLLVGNVFLHVKYVQEWYVT